MNGVSDGGVAFSAKLSTHTLFRTEEPLLFDEVLSNESSGFNPRTGEFTAPVLGHYLFSVTLRAQFRKQVSAEITCNGNMLGRITSGYGGIDRATSSVTVVVELKRNDVVHVKHTAEKSGEYHGNGYTTFSGILVD